MKNIWKAPLLALCVVFAGTTTAQEKTNTAALMRLQRTIGDQEKASLGRALALSREKGWPVESRDRAGNRVLLAGVDGNGFPVYIATESNLASAITIGTNKLWTGGSTGLNLNGGSASVSGKLGIWDGGRIRTSHVEFEGRIDMSDNASTTDNHATHVAGTLIAAGINPAAKGMAHDMRELVAYDFTNHTNEMTAEAANLLVSNHSYGQPAGWTYNSGQSRWEFQAPDGATEDYKFGYYSEISRQWDEIAFNAPNYLIVKSAGNSRNQNGPDVGEPYWGYNASNELVNKGNRPAGISNNDGYDILSTYSTSKNILLVGAVDAIPSGYVSASDVNISSFSAWGPTDDGRIKPDIVGVGVGVLSTNGNADNGYATLGGTSMATPNISGSLILLQELYMRENGGTPMRAATLKGIVLHAADEAGASPGPDYRHGWGLANMEKAAAIITNEGNGSRVEELTLNNGGEYTTTVRASGAGPLVVTICWTDPPGTVTAGTPLNNRTAKLVHDLDLRISRDGENFLPWRLNVNNPAAAATRADNTVDNIEKIEISNAVPGATYTITVRHKNSLTRANQAFSLIASGVNGTAYCASASSGSGAIMEQFTYNGFTFNAGNTDCVSYLDATVRIMEGEPSSTESFTLKFNRCVAGNVAKMAKVFIDFNNNGLFTDPGETAATTSVVNDNGSFTGEISLPASATIGSTMRVRIVVQETSLASAISPCGNYGNGGTYDFLLTVVPPSGDLAISSFQFPENGDCANPQQRVSVYLRNRGAEAIDSFPVNVTVMSEGQLLMNSNFYFRGTIEPDEEVEYTAPAFFNAEAGKTYDIQARVLLPDQNAANDVITTSVTMAGTASPPSGTAVICGPAARLRSSTNTGTLLWYTVPSGGVPVGTGRTPNTSSIPGNNTYYLAKDDYRVTATPRINGISGTAAYLSFSRFYYQINTTAPVLMESFRVYSANSGKATITYGPVAATNDQGRPTSYTIQGTVELDIHQSRPGTGAADTGHVYQVNIPLSAADEYVFMIDLEPNVSGTQGLSVAGHSGKDTSFYPMGDNVFQIVYNNTGENNFQGNFYMLYDMKVRSLACASERVPIVATVSEKPVISQNENMLTSNLSADLIQWYRNNVAIPGANGQSYTIIQPGSYTVEASNGGCPVMSDPVNALVTGLVDLDNATDGVLVSPNPNDGNFELAFATSATGQLSIHLFNTQGQMVFTESRSAFTGAYQRNMRLGHLAKGVYLLKIRHGAKEWSQKILITK